MTPWEYAKTLMGDCIKPVAVVIGDDHRFGRNRAGDFSTLKTLGEALGFRSGSSGRPSRGGRRVSSTKVREALRQGNVAEANKWLGAPYPTTGRVVHGDAVGRRVGLSDGQPATLKTPQTVPCPGRVRGVVPNPGRQWHPAMANVGQRPTSRIAMKPPLEVHVIGTRRRLVRTELHVRWMHWMRGEVKFASQGID